MMMWRSVAHSSPRTTGKPVASHIHLSRGFARKHSSNFLSSAWHEDAVCSFLHDVLQSSCG